MSTVSKMKKAGTSKEASEILRNASKALYSKFESGKITKQELNEKIADIKTAYNEILTAEAIAFLEY